MRFIKSFCFTLITFLISVLILCACGSKEESYMIKNVTHTDTTVNVEIRITNVTCDQVFVIILAGDKEFDRKIVVRENNTYMATYYFDGLLPKTQYFVKLVGVKDAVEIEDTIAIQEFTTDEAIISNNIEFVDQTYDYTGLEIIPEIKNMPSDAIVVFTPEDIYDAGIYEVTAEILFEDNHMITLSATITVRKVPYPKDYVFNVLPSKVHTGLPVEFDYFLVDNFETELSYKINGNIVEHMVEPGQYQVELLIKESTNYQETLLTFDFEIIETKADIFISEYLEGYYDKDYNPSGNSNDKALELYNPTATDIGLSGYKICIYKSGSTVANTTIDLSGTINSMETFVIVNLYASEELLRYADITGELYFSGKQAVALYHNDQLIDILGEIGAVYDEPLTINGIIGAFADNRLVRRAGIVGNTTFNEQEWEVIGNCNFDGLGYHDFIGNQVNLNNAIDAILIKKYY